MPSSIIHQVLCTLTACFFVGSHALPVVFPSFNTSGFANTTGNDTLLTIPAAFEHLLCKTPREIVNFATANKSCSRIVFFTSTTSLTLNFLNLSSFGVVQPLTMTPQVRSSQSSLSLCWNIPNDPSDDGECRTNKIEPQTPAEGPSRDQFEQGSNDENLNIGDEDSAEVQFRRLMHDGSGVNEQSTVQGIHPDVQKANDTAGFLYTNGTVMPDFSFVVQLYLEGLPEQELITLEFGFEDNITRSLLIYVDSSPVSVEIKQNEAPKENLKRQRVYCDLDVIFSTRILGRPNEGNFSCTGVTQPLNSLIDAAQFKRGQHSLTRKNLLAVVDASDALPKCPKKLPKKLDESSYVRLSNISANFTTKETGPDICQEKNGETPWKTVVNANFYIEGEERNISVTVIGEVVVSLFGMPVPRIVKTLYVAVQPATSPETEPAEEPDTPPRSEPVEEPEASPRSEPVEEPEAPPRSEPVEEPEAPPAPESPTGSVKTLSTNASSPSTRNEDSVTAMRMLGTALSGLTGAAAGLSFIASVGMPFLTFLNPANGAALTSELGCLSSVVDLMQIGQKTYLLTKLKVPNLPESFKAFGEQFSWTMLNFRAPWVTVSDSDNTTDTSQSSRRRLLSNDTSSEDGDSHEDPYSKLRDTYFWTGIALVVLGILHIVLLAIFMRYRNSVPGILRLPRLELYLIQSCIAIVAQGPAYLFTGTTRQIVIGVLVLTVGIIPLGVWHYHVIHKYLFDEGRDEKRIVYTLASVDMSEHGKRAVHIPDLDDDTDSPILPGRESVRRIPRENIQREGDHSWFSKNIVAVLLGPLYRSGEWTWRDGQAVRVVDRYGPVFEDYRGKPMYKSDPPQRRAGESDDRCEEFEPVGAEYRYPIDVPERSFLLRICEKVINLGTMVFVTLLILGEDDPESNYQAALLLTIQVIYVAYLRVFRPHCSRWKLGVAVFDRTMDAVSLFLVIWKLNIGHSTSRDNIGVAMAILEATAISMQLIDIVVTILPMLQKVKEAFWSGEPADTLPSVKSIFLRHPNLEIGFEEMMYDNPRKAISDKIIRPLMETLRSAGRRRRIQSGTDSNHYGSSTPNHTEAEQSTE